MKELVNNMTNEQIHVNLQNIDVKLSQLQDNMHKMQICIVEIQKDLSYHIQRTNLLQDEVTHISEKIKPIDAIKFSWTNILKLTALFASLSSIAAFSIKFFTNL